MSYFAERRDRRGRIAVLLTSIPAAFAYAAVWMTDTDLARHEQFGATAALTLAHLALSAGARAHARETT